MKKYRLTKITVKTREIISVPAAAAAAAANEAETAVCPVCRAPLPASLAAAAQSSKNADCLDAPADELARARN